MKEYINDANSGRLLMVTVRRLNQERERERWRRERDGGDRERGRRGGEDSITNVLYTLHIKHYPPPPPPPPPHTHTHTHMYTHTCATVVIFSLYRSSSPLFALLCR